MEALESGWRPARLRLDRGIMGLRLIDGARYPALQDARPGNATTADAT